MSSPATRVFLPALREVERELSMPLPDRVRVLSELEYDLEQLRRRFLSRGLTADEARTRALDALVPKGVALKELGRVHTPRYRRWTRRFGPERLKLVERAALAVATASVLLVETLALLQADLLEDPSPFLVPVLGLGALVFAAIAAKAFQLWVKRDHDAPRRGLGLIIGLAGLTLVAAVIGSILDLYRLAALVEASPELAESLAPIWLVRDSALLSAALVIALMGALGWLVLTQWTSLVTAAHRDLLGMDRSANAQGEPQ